MQETCKKCGNIVDAEEMFCGNCGAKVAVAHSPYAGSSQIRSSKKKSKTVLLVLTGIATLVLAALIGHFVFKPSNVTVPDIVNMSQVAAISEITTAGLVAGTVTTEYHNTVPQDSVISQNPSAGTSVESGTVVNLLVSNGTAIVPVPNVIDMTRVEAEITINEAGLIVGTITDENNKTVPKDSVIDQSLPAGISVARGTSVDLRVSSGPTAKPPTGSTGTGLVSVPNVTGMAYAQALSAITSAGLNSNRMLPDESHITIPAGSVTIQSPAAGTSVASGSVVNLRVSIGRPTGSTGTTTTTVTTATTSPPPPPPPPPPSEQVLGRDIKAYRLVEAQEFTGNNPGRMMGREYRYGFSTSSRMWISSNGSAYYNIGSRFTNMSGFYGPMDNAAKDAAATLTIYGDERILATFEMQAGDTIKQFNQNVTGISQIRFEFSFGKRDPVSGITFVGSDQRFGVADVTLSSPVRKTSGYDPEPKPVYERNSIELTVNGITSFSRVADLEKALRSLQQVENVSMGTYKSGSVTIGLDIIVPVESFMDILNGIRSPRLEVRERSGKNITTVMR